MTPQWREMREEDMAGVVALARRVHPDLPEGEAMFRNRLALYPEGCLVLEAGGVVEGYAVSHPIRRYEPPALDTLLEAIPEDADDYYIHDVAVAPQRRGGGHAAAGVAALLSNAGEYASASLVSVYGTAPYWSRYGFKPAEKDMGEKLSAYGTDALYMLRRD